VTMVLEDVRRAAHLQRESEALRAGLEDLRSVVDRMSKVLDRMERDEQNPTEGQSECPTT
jgi:hypothetical protein